MPAKRRPAPPRKATKPKARPAAPKALKLEIPPPLAQALEGAAKRLHLDVRDLILHLLDLNVAALAAAPRRKRKP
jgi:hypothetical protein